MFSDKSKVTTDIIKFLTSFIQLITQVQRPQNHIFVLRHKSSHLICKSSKVHTFTISLCIQVHRKYDKHSITVIMNESHYTGIDISANGFLNQNSTKSLRCHCYNEKKYSVPFFDIIDVSEQTFIFLYCSKSQIYFFLQSSISPTLLILCSFWACCVLQLGNCDCVFHLYLLYL